MPDVRVKEGARWIAFNAERTGSEVDDLSSETLDRGDSKAVVTSFRIEDRRMPERKEGKKIFESVTERKVKIDLCTFTR